MGAACAGAADVEMGRRLFTGELPLAGRVTGHTTDLPQQASRCVNCHAAGTAVPSASASASASAGPSTQSFGPVLNADLLAKNRPRRGGPPSKYDAAALCKLLTTGIDPAYIIIPRNMPRYDASIAECNALWAYLSQTR